MIRSRDEAKRDAILDAALALFCERSYAGCSVPAVATAAGVATGSIYRYFPSKEALVNELYRRHKTDLAGRLLLPGPPADHSARAAFDHWWSTLAAYVEQQPLAFQFLELHSHEHYLDDASREVAARVDLAAVAVVQEGQRRGELADTPAPLLVALVFGAFTGVVRARRAYPQLFDDDAFAAAGEATWRLLAAPSPRP